MSAESFDGSSLGQAFARPGMDSRQWTSIGVVENAVGGTSAVDFSAGYPLVNVRLHPSDNSVRCRVAAAHAGVGEGEWTPFQAGDEVIIAFPQGDERAGGIITGRLNNGVDTFPNVVAGLDVTQNNVSTRRTIPNYVWELENGWMILNDATQAQLAMDATGNWAMLSGEGDYIRLGATGISLVTKSNALSFQIGESAPMLFVMDPSSGAVTLMNAGGNVYIGAAGSAPADHVLTVEGFCNLMQAWGLTLTAIPIVGTALAATLTALTLPAWIAAAAGLPSTPAITAAIAGALAVPRVPGASSGVGAAGVIV